MARPTPGRTGTRQVARATAVVGLFAGATLAGTTSAAAEPEWAPADSADIHPGVVTETEGGQCTSNFIFSDGSDVYIGQAAHCSSTSGSTSTDGCEAESHPLGTEVDVDGASKPGTLVYNSWLTMQHNDEDDADTCAYNDLALVKLDKADVGNVNPSVPFWGGPTGLRNEDTAAGDELVSYGNSSLRLGIDPLKPKQGFSLGSTGGSWSHDAYTMTPGIPGDSGSSFLDDEGRALGVLSTLALAPLPASNGIGDLANELDYMHNNAAEFSDIALVEGTESFRGTLP